MHASDTLRAVLSGLPRVTLHGPWSRAVGFHLLTSPPPGAPPGTPPQPLWPGGAKQRGARFTPQHGFDSLYLASDPITALAEVVAVFQPSHGPLVTLKTNPWVVVTVEGVLHDIVDLTAEFWMVRIAPRIDDREFARMWRKLARPVTLFDEASPTHFSSGRNRRIL